MWRTWGRHVGAALWGVVDVFSIANIKVDQSGVLLCTQQSFSGHHENNDRTTGGLSMPKLIKGNHDREESPVSIA